MSTIDLLRVSCVSTDDACHVQLVGEADFSVLDELTRALRCVRVGRGQEVRLDVGGLEFIDLACMRALVDFARRAERAGVRVRVEQPNTTFTRLRGMLVSDAPAGA